MSDTGKGIGPDMLKNLFQTFVQEDESVHRIYGGSGLGLAICQGIAELMGTRIQVASEKGMGARFWFEPEFEISREEARQSMDVADQGRLKLDPKKCLVVQDDLMSQKVAKLLLEKLGMNVEVVDSGEKSVKRVQETAYDYIFMDIKMLGISGIEATRQIRKLNLPHAQPRIIALTGSVMESERAAYSQAGMDGCLAKPLLLEDLVKVF